MKMSKDKALIINLFTMVALIITAICDFIFFNGDKLFRVVLMAVTLWLMYFVYKRTFLKKYQTTWNYHSCVPTRFTLLCHHVIHWRISIPFPCNPSRIIRSLFMKQVASKASMRCKTKWICTSCSAPTIPTWRVSF